MKPSHHSPADPNYAISVVDACLRAAIERGASDLHFQPRADRWEVLLRIDGVLGLYENFAVSHQSDPVARLMAMAGLPSYLSGVPQEGPLRWANVQGENHEMRLGIFPTVHGNRAAIRFMAPRQSIRSLDQLGFDADIRASLCRVCEARDGWVLVAGPPGSGKTTTLYACLNSIAASQYRRSVLTIEDPIEAILPSVNQSQLQPSSGLTLASAMKAAVRQDSEVLLVSEIRDVDTADAVLSASMTGHLCFSSIHAGSIGTTLRRLTQMQLPTFAIQSGLRAVVCQRLLRCVCDSCDRSSDDCSKCHGSRYSGRIPIAQMITFDGDTVGQSIFQALADQNPANEIDSILSQSGNASLHQRAMDLVQKGLTDQAEVYRVLGIGI
jgi:general secretion pathway protein E